MASKMDYKKKLMEYRKSIEATPPTIMRPVAFKNVSSNLDESDNQLNFSHPQPLQSLQHSTEDDNYTGRNRWSKTKEYKSSMETAPAPATIRTASFQDLVSNLDKLDHQNNTPYLYVQLQQFQQASKLDNVEKDNFISEDRRSTIGESSVLRASSPFPSSQAQLHQSVLPTPGCIRGRSFLPEPVGRYVNWNSHHAFLASQAWCCIGDLIALCDKYEFKAISVSDVQAHANIVNEVRSVLGSKAPFEKRRRFPGCIRNTENLFVCIGRCPSIEYHLERILNAFRRPLNKLSTEKQNIAKQNFHLAVRELHLDISARILEIKLYDRNVFEKEFHLKWQDDLD